MQHHVPVHARGAGLGLQLVQQQRVEVHALQLGAAVLRRAEAVEQFSFGTAGQARVDGDDEQAALAQAALQAVFGRCGVDHRAVGPGAGAQHRALARELRRGAGRGCTAQRGGAVGADTVGSGGVPVQRGTGLFKQAVQLGAAGQRRGLGVAATHAGLQRTGAERGADEGVDGLLQRLQRRHATRIDFLPA